MSAPDRDRPIEPPRPAPPPAAPPRPTPPAPAADACPICGGPLLGMQCKLICENCGYREDCSDLFRV